MVQLASCLLFSPVLSCWESRSVHKILWQKFLHRDVSSLCLNLGLLVKFAFWASRWPGWTCFCYGSFLKCSIVCPFHQVCLVFQSTSSYWSFWTLGLSESPHSVRRAAEGVWWARERTFAGVTDKWRGVWVWANQMQRWLQCQGVSSLSMEILVTWMQKSATFL